MNDKELKLQTEDPDNPVTDPNPPQPDFPPEDPNPYPVSDLIPDVEPVPTPPEPTPEFPPDVIY